MEGDSRFDSVDFQFMAFDDEELYESNACSVPLHEDEGYASCMATHEAQDAHLVAGSVKAAGCRKVHAHHGTNASSDAAGRTRRYHCSFQSCGKEFSTSGHLTRHNRIHTGEKNYACSECGARFSRQDNCNQHAKSHGKLARSASTRKPDPVSIEHKPESEVKSQASELNPSLPPTIHDSPELTRPGPAHTVSYANSLVASEAGYTSSTNDCEQSPVINQKYEVLASQFSKLPQSIFDQILDALPPSLVYDSSTAETDESYQSFSTQDFISEEDFYSWSAGVSITGEWFEPAHALSDI